MPIVLDGTNGITQADQFNSDSTFGFKNRIINGAMVIDQRNAGASINNSTSGVYSVDRWKTYGAASAKFSIQQNAGSVTPPAGFVNYLGVTSLAATTPGSSDQYDVYQLIEGYNIADLNWGSANAKTVTLSFWVRSSLTGTFGGVLKNTAATRSYPFSYTISAANTWEYKTITAVGPTDGTWETTTSTGIIVLFSMGGGSSLLGTAGAWASANYVGVTGQTNIVGTSGATFYITGVQLEVGSTATSFDYRPYGTELQLCQRYYTRFGGTGSGDSGIGTAFRDSASQAQVILQPPTTLRATPSVTFNGTISSIGGGNQVTLTVPASIALFNNYVRFKATQTGYTSLQNYFVYLASGSTDFIELSSEL